MNNGDNGKLHANKSIILGKEKAPGKLIIGFRDKARKLIISSDH